MADNPTRTNSFEFALKINRFPGKLQRQREYVISKVIVKSAGRLK